MERSPTSTAATERATGYGRAELLGTEFSDYFTEPDTGPGRLRAGLPGWQRRATTRWSCATATGTITSVLYNASVYRDPSGRVLGVFAAARDVTQVKRTQAALRESEERLRAMFDNAPVGISELSPSGEFVRVNPRFCQIHRLHRRRTAIPAAARTSPIPTISTPISRSCNVSSPERSIPIRSRSATCERTVTVVWAEVSHAAGPRLRTATRCCIVGACTRHHRAARRRSRGRGRSTPNSKPASQQRTADLERANKNLEAFTYSVAHDLRAPLRALSGFSEALLEDYGDRLDETGRGYARPHPGGERADGHAHR